MENIGGVVDEVHEDYNHYWETKMFLQNEELFFPNEEIDSWGWDEPISGYYDSSSPDGAASSSATAKNIVSERNRRKKLNERLFALRAVVPNISKLRVSEVGEKTSVITITCSKNKDTMVKLCEVFESLKLKIITANITAFPGMLSKTLFVEADEIEKAQLKEKIEMAIADIDAPKSPMSF
ncbi:hypothetical protein AAC387_Pa05g2379 [Persea americana]